MKRYNVYIVRYTDSHVLRQQTDGRFVVDYLENWELPARNAPGENGADAAPRQRGQLAVCGSVAARLRSRARARRAGHRAATPVAKADSCALTQPRLKTTALNGEQNLGVRRQLCTM